MSELVQLMCVCVRVLSGVYVMQHCWCMAGATQLLLKLHFWHGHLVLRCTVRPALCPAHCAAAALVVAPPVIRWQQV
jgi:hypothetical protein